MNLPGAAAGVDGVVAAVAAAVVAAEAAIVVAPYSTAPATPPTSIDPAIAAAAIDFRKPFISPSPFGFIRSRRALIQRLTANPQPEMWGTWELAEDRAGLVSRGVSPTKTWSTIDSASDSLGSRRLNRA